MVFSLKAGGQTSAPMSQKYWQKLSGPKLLKLIIAVSAIAVSYEGMSQGVQGAVNVAPEYGVSCFEFEIEDTH